MLDKVLPDLISSYRNNEHDLSVFFASHPSDSTQTCAAILLQLSSFDALPSPSSSKKNPTSHEQFDRIEWEWSRLKLLIPVDNKAEDSLELNPKEKTCELNWPLFVRLVEIYGKNVRFIQQLKDKHTVRIAQFLFL